MNGSGAGGTAACTASSTCSYCCGPVTARTRRVRAADVVGSSAPRQPVTMTRPFSRQRLADGLEALGLGAVEEAAGVDDHRVGAGVVGRDRVALGAQPGQDALAVDQRLGAAEADHADAAAGPGRRGASSRGAGRAVGAEVGRVQGHRAAHSRACAPRAQAERPDRARPGRGATGAAVRLDVGDDRVAVVLGLRARRRPSWCPSPSPLGSAR